MRAGLDPTWDPQGWWMVQVYPHTGVHPLSTGYFFRGLWGPRAGWAQAVSTPLPGTFVPHPSHAHPIISPLQVLFCADLHKGQKPASS